MLKFFAVAFGFSAAAASLKETRGRRSMSSDILIVQSSLDRGKSFFGKICLVPSS